jgi:hypothetical protein
LVLGVGVWVLGFGVWAPTPNPQSPIPNPQSPFPYIYINYLIKLKDFILYNSKKP